MKACPECIEESQRLGRRALQLQEWELPGWCEEGVLGLCQEVWWLCRVDRDCDGSER